MAKKKNTEQSSEVPKKDKNDNLIMWKPGQSGNPNGRPKKYTTLAGDAGYTLKEVQTTIKVLLVCSLDELQEVFANPDSTVLEILIAKSLSEDIRRGRTDTIDKLMSRVWGLPRMTFAKPGDDEEEADVKSKPPTVHFISSKPITKDDILKLPDFDDK